MGSRWSGWGRDRAGMGPGRAALRFGSALPHRPPGPGRAEPFPTPTPGPPLPAPSAALRARLSPCAPCARCASPAPRVTAAHPTLGAGPGPARCRPQSAISPLLPSAPRCRAPRCRPAPLRALCRPLRSRLVPPHALPASPRGRGHAWAQRPPRSLGPSGGRRRREEGGGRKEEGGPPRRDRVGPNRSTREWNFCSFAKGNPERMENKGVSTLQPALLGREQRVPGRFCGFCRELQAVPWGSVGTLRCTELTNPPLLPLSPPRVQHPPQLRALCWQRGAGDPGTKPGGGWHQKAVAHGRGAAEHWGAQGEQNGDPTRQWKGPHLGGTGTRLQQGPPEQPSCEQSAALGVPRRMGAAGIRPQVPAARRLWLASTAAPCTASCCAAAQTCLAMHACVPGAAAATSPAQQQDELLCHRRAELAALLPWEWRRELSSRDLGVGSRSLGAGGQ